MKKEAFTVLLFVLNLHCNNPTDNLKENLQNFSQQLTNLTNALIPLPTDSYFDEYKNLFEPFPQQYWLPIWEKLKEHRLITQLEKQDPRFPFFLWRSFAEIIDPSITPLLGFDGYMRFYINDNQGQPGKPGLRNELTVSKIGPNSQNDTIKAELIQNYKIHLMPKLEDLNATLLKLFEEFQKNQTLQGSLNAFKVKKDINNIIHYNEVFPLIVLYPNSGKQHAQNVLDIVRKIYQDQEGMNVTPRYNQKVTSLIYFAQGDGDHKSREPYQKYYEQPDKIYYAKDFTPEGANNGYHLNF